MTAATRTGLALLLAALILGVCPTTWPAAPGPVVTDASTVEPTLAPPDPDGTVARVLVETRGGVRP